MGFESRARARARVNWMRRRRKRVRRGGCIVGLCEMGWGGGGGALVLVLADGGRLASEEQGKSGEGEGDEVAVDAKGAVEAVAHGGLGGQSVKGQKRCGGQVVK